MVIERKDKKRLQSLNYVINQQKYIKTTPKYKESNNKQLVLYFVYEIELHKIVDYRTKNHMFADHCSLNLCMHISLKFLRSMKNRR